jgi:hypothetical protein
LGLFDLEAVTFFFLGVATLFFFLSSDISNLNMKDSKAAGTLFFYKFLKIFDFSDHNSVSSPLALAWRVSIKYAHLKIIELPDESFLNNSLDSDKSAKKILRYVI